MKSWKNNPGPIPSMLMSVVGGLEGVRQIVVVGKKGHHELMTAKFLSEIWGRLLVNTVVIHLDPESMDERILSHNEVLHEVLKIPSLEGIPFVTICEGYTCGLPIRDVENLNTVLK
jgi:uncharacterized protein YyaL (SSP411 family)